MLRRLLSWFKKRPLATEGVDESSDAEDWDSTPPTQEDAVHRVAALGVHLWRAQLELHSGRGTSEKTEIESRFREVSEWMGREGIDAMLSPSESALADLDLGSWSQSQVFENVWRFEALSALLWSLNLLEPMPSYLELVDGHALLQKTPLHSGVARISSAADLRASDEIETQQEAAMFWHWRTRTEMFKRQGMSPPPGETYGATIARAVADAHSTGLVANVKDGDVEVDGLAYGELAQEAWGPIASLSVERHFALNWLCGYAPGNAWDETPTDT